MQKLKFLHIYGQGIWHDPAFIVGNISALEALRDAIEQAIKDLKITKADFCTNDGEGYEVFVIVDEKNIRRRALPYTDEVARERNPNAQWPWQDVSSKSKKRENKRRHP